MNKHQEKNSSFKVVSRLAHSKSKLINFLKRIVRRRCEWAIGIYIGDSPYKFVSPRNIRNPILTARDVTDLPASFIADPFMISKDNTWYMFFEVMNARTNKGDIGLATSTDGLKWNYRQIVLHEPFHLSYPYVFQWKNNYYMLPESCQSNSIRLYKALNFPMQWVFAKTLLDESDCVDPSIFRFSNKWWLFTTSITSNILRLYYADELTSSWFEHPKSPIIQGNSSIARPGGRVVVLNDRIIRYTQDDESSYGKQVRAFEIIDLTTTTYKEKEVKENPILKASGYGWNAVGMHHIDPHQIDEGKWIACVDGHRLHLVF